MAKIRNYQLSEEDLQKLERAMHNDGRVEVVQRATAIRQLHQGKTPQEVGEIMAVNASSVYHWWQRWQAEGIDGLSHQARQGRPPKTDAGYWVKLDEVLEQEPSAFGYVFTLWTTARLRDHLARETGIKLSTEWLRVQMERRGYVYRRPKADLRVNQDPQARAEAEKVLEGLKKTHKVGISSCSLWMKRP